MVNLSLHKTQLSEITKNTFKEAIWLAFECGITDRAPLGYSGNDIRLFGTMIDGHRESIIDIRNHSGTINILITDLNGNFLLYNSYDPNLGLNKVVNKIMSDFNFVKDNITKGLKDIKFDINQKRKIKPLNGFKKLSKYQTANGLQ